MTRERESPGVGIGHVRCAAANTEVQPSPLRSHARYHCGAHELIVVVDHNPTGDESVSQAAVAINAASGTGGTPVQTVSLRR